MRIVFMGTPDFAAASLKKLIDENYDIAGVFTQPDKPRGRGMEMSFSPVKELALQHDLPVFQPEKMRDGTALQTIQELKPDILVLRRLILTIKLRLSLWSKDTKRIMVSQ